jgi:pimeloyl-ACP methyl ester carboxylesterase
VLPVRLSAQAVVLAHQLNEAQQLVGQSVVLVGR